MSWHRSLVPRRRSRRRGWTGMRGAQLAAEVEAQRTRLAATARLLSLLARRPQRAPQATAIPSRTSTAMALRRWWTWVTRHIQLASRRRPRACCWAQPRSLPYATTRSRRATCCPRRSSRASAGPRCGVSRAASRRLGATRDAHRAPSPRPPAPDTVASAAPATRSATAHVDAHSAVPPAPSVQGVGRPLAG